MLAYKYILVLFLTDALAQELWKERSYKRRKPQIFPVDRGDRRSEEAFGSCVAWLLEAFVKSFRDSGSLSLQDTKAQPSLATSFLGPLIPEIENTVSFQRKAKATVGSYPGNFLQQEQKQQVYIPSDKGSSILPNGGQTGPNDKVFIDTGGDDFDRFLVHRLKGIDALGYPLYNKWNTAGAVWKDGNVQIVNTDGNGFFGNPIQAKDSGFHIPINDILATLKGLGRLGQEVQKRKTTLSSDIR